MGSAVGVMHACIWNYIVITESEVKVHLKRYNIEVKMSYGYNFPGAFVCVCLCRLSLGLSTWVLESHAWNCWQTIMLISHAEMGATHNTSSLYCFLPKPFLLHVLTLMKNINVCIVMISNHLAVCSFGYVKKQKKKKLFIVPVHISFIDSAVIPRSD